MSVFIETHYSSSTPKLKLNLEDDVLTLVILDSDYDKVGKYEFDADKFRKHLQIASELRQRIELKPKSEDSEYGDKMIVQYSKRDDDDMLSFDIGSHYFYVNLDDFWNTTKILLS